MKRVVITSLLRGIIALSLFFTACNNTHPKSSCMKNYKHSDNSKVYACPMHPEIQGEKGDKCSKCGMDLAVVSDENSVKNKVTLNTFPQPVEAGIPAELIFMFKENGHTIPLDISHEMKVHLIIVDEKLSWFRHIHPKEQSDGSYTISETFPHANNYFLFIDHKPQGAASLIVKKEINVKGNSDSNKIDFSTKLVSVIEDYTVTLENGDELKTNRTQSLEISVKKNNKKLSESDIEPYLGATAHIAMISKEEKEFLHIHPISNDLFPIYAETHIKKQGLYKIWVEFQINGKVHTADFIVKVTEGKEVIKNNAHNHRKHSHK